MFIEGQGLEEKDGSAFEQVIELVMNDCILLIDGSSTIAERKGV